MTNETSIKRFGLGQCVITPGASEYLAQCSMTPDYLLARHLNNDWGDLEQEDKATNDYAIDHDERIFSSYNVCGESVWVITEADRSATTILLPSEY